MLVSQIRVENYSRKSGHLLIEVFVIETAYECDYLDSSPKFRLKSPQSVKSLFVEFLELLRQS